MPYPKTFYDSEHFGLWPIGDKRVEYRCTLILHRLQLAATFEDSNRSLLNTQLMWDADRCLCDMQRQDDVKKSGAHHWHTERAAQAIDAGDLGKIRFEHAIPRKLVFDELRAAFTAGQIVTWEHVRNYLQPRRAIALVHKDEDDQLNARWRQTMPTGWQVGGEVVDAFARYRAMNIELRPPRPAPPAGETTGGGERLQILTALFDRPDWSPENNDYRRVGGAEDHEWLDTEDTGQELTNSVALNDWLPALRKTTNRNYRTDGYATGLPVVVWFEIVGAELVVYLGRGYMDDAALQNNLSTALGVRNGATARRTLAKFALAAHGQAPVAAVAAALIEIRNRLDRVTEAMMAAGVLG